MIKIIKRPAGWISNRGKEMLCIVGIKDWDMRIKGKRDKICRKGNGCSCAGMPVRSKGGGECIHKRTLHTRRTIHI